jgi:hypothetical protein
MPIYIKRSEIFRVEKQKTLVKYLIHKELITVCTARKIVHYKDNVKILKLDLPDLTEAEGSSQIVPIMLSIDNKEFPKTEFEITHNSIGKLFSDRLGEAEKITKDQNHFDETSIYDMIKN